MYSTHPKTRLAIELLSSADEIKLINIWNNVSVQSNALNMYEIFDNDADSMPLLFENMRLKDIVTKAVEGDYRKDDRFITLNSAGNLISFNKVEEVIDNFILAEFIDEFHRFFNEDEVRKAFVEVFADEYAMNNSDKFNFSLVAEHLSFSDIVNTEWDVLYGTYCHSLNLTKEEIWVNLVTCILANCENQEYVFKHRPKLMLNKWGTPTLTELIDLKLFPNKRAWSKYGIDISIVDEDGHDTENLQEFSKDEISKIFFIVKKEMMS